MKKMKGGIMFNQREIVLLPFPYSDLSGAKLSPALILSNKSFNQSEDRICCLVTSKEPSFKILITQEDLELGELPFMSWAKPSRIFTVSEKIIKRRLCKVNSKFHHRLLQQIMFYLKEA